MDLLSIYILSTFIFGRSNEKEERCTKDEGDISGLFFFITIVLAFFIGSYLPSIAAGPLFPIIDAMNAVQSDNGDFSLIFSPIISLYKGGIIIMSWGLCYVLGCLTAEGIKKRKNDQKDLSSEIFGKAGLIMLIIVCMAMMGKVLPSIAADQKAYEQVINQSPAHKKILGAYNACLNGRLRTHGNKKFCAGLAENLANEINMGSYYDGVMSDYQEYLKRQ